MLKYLFLNTCVLCGRETSPLSVLCEECETKILKKGPSFYSESHRNYEMFVYSDYRDELEQLIKLYKYRKERQLSKFLVRVFVKLYSYFPRQADMVTWIPSSLDSLEERGFDHMELIAKKITKFLKIPAAKLLENISKGRQVERRREERKKMGRFVCRKIPPRNIILLDDVMTTGTSIKDSVKVLLENGANRVFVYILARTT
ncbi:competence protein ComFC [Thermotoga sp. KOL6]|nr:competence protein ComFC [Thermotoga sp. KOL6]